MGVTVRILVFPGFVAEQRLFACNYEYSFHIDAFLKKEAELSQKNCAASFENSNKF